MQIGKAPFLVNVLECNNSDILVWQEQAKSIVGRNVVNSEPRKDEKMLAIKVLLRKMSPTRTNSGLLLGPFCTRGQQKGASIASKRW